MSASYNISIFLKSHNNWPSSRKRSEVRVGYTAAPLELGGIWSLAQGHISMVNACCHGDLISYPLTMVSCRPTRFNSFVDSITTATFKSEKSSGSSLNSSMCYIGLTMLLALSLHLKSLYHLFLSQRVKQCCLSTCLCQSPCDLLDCIGLQYSCFQS